MNLKSYAAVGSKISLFQSLDLTATVAFIPHYWNEVAFKRFGKRGDVLASAGLSLSF